MVFNESASGYCVQLVDLSCRNIFVETFVFFGSPYFVSRYVASGRYRIVLRVRSIKFKTL